MKGTTTSAFPFKYTDQYGTNNVYTGLSVREYLAAMAMQGIASRAHLETNSMAALAVLSVQAADALLNELEKSK